MLVAKIKRQIYLICMKIEYKNIETNGKTKTIYCEQWIAFCQANFSATFNVSIRYPNILYVRYLLETWYDYDSSENSVLRRGRS